MDIKKVITEQDYKGFNALTYDKFIILIEKIVKLSVEESLRHLPIVITSLSNQAEYLKKLSSDFYTNNKDLDTPEGKKVVSKLIEELEGKNPGISYEELIKDIAPKARKILNARIHA